MGRYRSGRYPSRETPLQKMLIIAGSLLFVCLFIWIFAQPGMWNMGSFLAVAPKSTPTAVPTQVPSDSNTITGLLGFAGICAIVMGGGGLAILGLYVFLQRQSVKNKTTAGPTSTSMFSQPVPSASESNVLPVTNATAQVISQPLQDQADTGSRPAIVDTVAEPEPDWSVEAHRILTRPERAFFWAFFEAVKDKYYIFPQIPLRQLIVSGMRRDLPRELFGMLQGGIADYVLADVTSLGAGAVIELDDPSHSQADARARDRRKDDFLRQVGIPSIRFQSGKSWDANLIRQQIVGETLSGHTIVLMDDWECAFFRVLRQVRDDCFIFPKASLRQFIR
ncbi:MAG: DUF2726 domain-containing protein, partial [Chloroflexota bacterium]|nr:DUF2726 domain-containing protein [Chloroflexota bacterium]